MQLHRHKGIQLYFVTIYNTEMYHTHCTAQSHTSLCPVGDSWWFTQAVGTWGWEDDVNKHPPAPPLVVTAPSITWAWRQTCKSSGCGQSELEVQRMRKRNRQGETKISDYTSCCLYRCGLPGNLSELSLRTENVLLDVLPGASKRATRNLDNHCPVSPPHTEHDSMPKSQLCVWSVTTVS